MNHPGRGITSLSRNIRSFVRGIVHITVTPLAESLAVVRAAFFGVCYLGGLKGILKMDI